MLPFINFAILRSDSPWAAELSVLAAQHLWSQGANIIVVLQMYLDQEVFRTRSLLAGTIAILGVRHTRI